MSEPRRVDVLSIAPFALDADRGSPLRARRLLRIARDLGMHVDTLAYRGPAGERLCVTPIAAPTRPGFSWRKIVFDLELLVRALVHAARHRPPTIEGHVHEGLFIALIARVVSPGSQVVYNAHGTLADELAADGRLRAGGRVHRMVLHFEAWLERRADHVLAQSEHRAATARAHGVDADRIVVCPDAPEPELYQLAERSRESRTDGVLCVYTGSMVPYQGVDDLLEAARMTHGVRFVFFGGPAGSYPAEAHALGVDDRVTFVDPAPVAELAAVLAAADIAVAPRRYGGNIPGKVPAYQAAGLPIVGTDVGGIASVVTPDDGVLVPPHDPAALAQAIQSLADDPELRCRLGRRAAETARLRDDNGRVRAALLHAYAPRGSTRGTWTRRARAAWAVTVATIVVLTIGMVRGAVPDLTSVAWPRAVLAIALLITANDLICGLRWSLFTSDDRPKRRWDDVRRYAEAAAVGAFVPLAGDAVRARTAGRLEPVVTDRLVSGVTIGAAASVGAAHLAGAASTTLVVAVAAAFTVATAAWLRRRPLRPTLAAAAVSLTLLYIVVTALALVALAGAAGASLPLRDALAAAPVLLLVSAVPAIGPIGPGVVTLGGIVVLAGGTAQQAATAAALLLLGLAAVVSVGALSLIGRRVRRPLGAATLHRRVSP